MIVVFRLTSAKQPSRLRKNRLREGSFNYYLILFSSDRQLLRRQNNHLSISEDCSKRARFCIPQTLSMALLRIQGMQRSQSHPRSDARFRRSCIPLAFGKADNRRFCPERPQQDDFWSASAEFAQDISAIFPAARQWFSSE